MNTPYNYSAVGFSKQRSGWTQSKSHKASIPFGKLVPLGAPIDVLPNDTWKAKVGSILRMLTPKAPLMDGISGDIYAYFTPYRLLFDRTKQFFGQNESEAWTLNLSHNLPHIKTGFSQGSYAANTDSTKYKLSLGATNFFPELLDHFELPFCYINADQYSSLPSSPLSAGVYNISFQALPLRNYQLIWNFDFRNPAVIDPALTFAYDHSDVTSISTNAAGFTLKPVMRYRDIFSSGLKSPQRGPSVPLPLGDLAPVGVIKTGTTTTTFTYDKLFVGTTAENGPVFKQLEGANQDPSSSNTQNGLVTDLSAATAATVNQLRIAIATQHLYELMTSAFRYNEYINIFFGINPSNMELDNPVQLGGIHFDVNVSQVLSTANSGGQAVGDTGAVSVTNIKGHLFTQSFQEHGLIQLFVVLRKEHTYVQGLDKYWSKRDFFDIFQPPLEGIGNVDIKNSEVYIRWKDSGVNLDDGAFAYQEPYYEYRYMQSRACGLMNPLHPNSLSFYSLTDVLASKPYLNDAFVSEDPNGLDNALVASATVTDQFFGDFYFRFDCYRPMKLRDVPGLNRI